MSVKSFDELLQCPTVKTERAEGDDLGPCASRPNPHGCTGFCVLNGKEDTRAFEYHHLGFANFSADGTAFVIEFNEPEKWRLSVKGRKLWQVFLNLHRHRLEWIRNADRDFAENDTPVITNIRIARVTNESSDGE